MLETQCMPDFFRSVGSLSEKGQTCFASADCHRGLRSMFTSTKTSFASFVPMKLTNIVFGEVARRYLNQFHQSAGAMKDSMSV